MVSSSTAGAHRQRGRRQEPPELRSVGRPKQRRGRGVRSRRRAAIGGIVGGVGHKRHEGCGTTRRGGVKARDGACGSGNVIAIVRTGLSTVGKLIDCDLVDIARTHGIAADRGIVIEHAVDHRPGLGLIHGVSRARDGGNAIVGVTALERTGQAGEKCGRRLCGIGLIGRSRRLRHRPLLLRGNRGGLELAVGPAKLSGAAHGIGLKQAAIVLGAILGDAQRGCVDAHARHRTNGKGNSARDNRLVDRRERQRRGIHHHGGGKADPAGKSGKDCSLCCIRRSHELSPSSSTQIASFSWLRERR